MTVRYPLQTAAHADGRLLAAVLTAPHCAIRPGDGTDSHVLHAVTLEELAAGFDGRRTFTAACGADGLRLVSVEMKGYRPLPWPPRVVGLGTLTRCRDCWVKTGKKRPRSERIEETT